MSIPIRKEHIVTKTEELRAKIAAGTHRLSPLGGGRVDRWYAKDACWITCATYRKDVVRRVQSQLIDEARRVNDGK